MEQYSDGLRVTFRPARENETNSILALYKLAVGTRFCTWNEEYPGLLEIHTDMETGNLFVLEADDRIIGAASVVPENEMNDFDCWSLDRNAGEFSRVVIHPAFQGKHLAKILVSRVLEVMKKRGCEAVHISVAQENIPAQKVYRNLGFRTVGQKEMWGHWFYLCELKLRGWL